MWLAVVQAGIAACMGRGEASGQWQEIVLEATYRPTDILSRNGKTQVGQSELTSVQRKQCGTTQQCVIGETRPSTGFKCVSPHLS